jgi:predicted O-methyltransferase YrrM
MKTLAIGLPHVNDYSGATMLSMFGMLATWGQRFLPLEEEGALIDSARNRIFRKAQTENADYLLFVDSDMVFPADALQKLINLDKDIASGVYFSRKAPHRPIVYEWTGKKTGVHRNLVYIPEEPFKVDSVGAGFLLISRKVLDGWTPEVYQKHGRPFTRILSDDGKTGADHLGEDTSFCLRCKELGYEVWADPTFTLGHRGSATVTEKYWEQTLTNIRNSDKTDGVHGWTTEKELKFLAEKAENASNVVEIGSWKGRSTKVLLEASEGFVHAIDHFKGTSEVGDGWSGFLAEEQDIYEEFMKNVGDYANLRVHKMGSADAVELFSDNSLDLVFIDGDHTYDGIIADIDNYLPKVKSGGTICGHDYTTGFPDVIKAVHERFDNVKVVDTIWYAEVA